MTGRVSLPALSLFKSSELRPTAPLDVCRIQRHDPAFIYRIQQAFLNFSFEPSQLIFPLSLNAVGTLNGRFRHDQSMPVTARVDLLRKYEAWNE
jgi:hypothetical protein